MLFIRQIRQRTPARSRGGNIFPNLLRKSCVCRGPGIQAIFELGFEPKEELFHELTLEQYSQLEREGRDISKKWFTILPKEQKYNVPELLIVDEEEKGTLLDAAEYINNMCSDEGGKREFSSFEEKLEYVAGILPDVFSGSSRYAKKKETAHLKKIK